MVIRSFIDAYSGTVKKKFEILMSGGYIIQNIKEGLTYDYIHSSEENLWSVLYFTGYLTRAKEEVAGKNVFALSVPSAEVMEIFEDAVEEWFSETSNQWDKKTLFDAVCNRDDKVISAEMTKLLRQTISYHDYKEDFYYTFFAGIFAGAGYIVEPDKEHGEGRSDIIVQDYTGGRMAVFEVKYSKYQDGLEDECLKAITQIDDKMYAKEFEEDYSQVICYGISFYKKTVYGKSKKISKNLSWIMDKLLYSSTV